MKSAASFRQKRCRFFLCALALFLAFPAAGGDGGRCRQPSGVAGETPRGVAASLGMGWNLGNQMDAFADGVAQETVWGNPPVGQAFFDSLSAAGFTSVRIPVTWMGHFGPAPDYRIEPDYLERVAQLVGYAKRAGLNVILNIHHDGADSRYWLDIGGAARSRQKDDTVRQTLTALWTQIARRFRNEGDYLVFESMNEIHDGRWGWGDNLKDGGRQYAVLNGWNQAFVRAVRATGGCNVRRFLAVPGYVTNIDLTVRHFRLPADTVPRRLMVAVHYYAPVAYTLDGKRAGGEVPALLSGIPLPGCTRVRPGPLLLGQRAGPRLPLRPCHGTDAPRSAGSHRHHAPRPLQPRGGLYAPPHLRTQRSPGRVRAGGALCAVAESEIRPVCYS